MPVPTYISRRAFPSWLSTVNIIAATRFWLHLQLTGKLDNTQCQGDNQF